LKKNKNLTFTYSQNFHRKGEKKCQITNPKNVKKATIFTS